MENVPPSSDSQAKAPVTPVEPVSTTKVLGIERRLIGFGFGLFLIMVILAVVYSQYAGRHESSMSQHEMKQERRGDQTGAPKQGASAPAAAAPVITGSVTPEGVVDNLVDEALAEGETANASTEDEMADVEDGSNN